MENFIPTIKILVLYYHYFDKRSSFCQFLS